MNIIFLILIFIFGLLVGSFLNVFILRYKTGLSIVNGRSICFSCGHKLRWYELIPLFSFLFLRGKCRECKTPISIQYPLVELLTAFIFVGVAIRQYYYWSLFGIYQNGFMYSVFFFVYYCLIFSILIIIAVYDIKHKVIPQFLVYTFIGLAVLKLLLYFYLFVGVPSLVSDFLDLISPILVSAPFFIFWFVSRGKWMGFGDVQLAFGIGALLGISCGLSVAVLSFWLGALLSISMIIRERIKGGSNISMKTEVPFAPFLISATIIVFFTHVDILSLDKILSLLQN